MYLLFSEKQKIETREDFDLYFRFEVYLLIKGGVEHNSKLSSI